VPWAGVVSGCVQWIVELAVQLLSVSILSHYIVMLYYLVFCCTFLPSECQWVILVDRWVILVLGGLLWYVVVGSVPCA